MSKLESELRSAVVKGVEDYIQSNFSEGYDLMANCYYYFYLTNSNFTTCRESACHYIKRIPSSDNKRVLGFLSKHGMHKCMTYINKVEKSFGLKGEPTKLFSSAKVYRSKEVVREAISNVLIFNKEWLISPTMYQIALLIVRMFVMDEDKNNKIYLGIKSFRKKTPFSVFHCKELPSSIKDYKRHIEVLNKIGYALLKNRNLLFDSSKRNDEWSSDTVDTNYGPADISYMPATSGTTSLAIYLNNYSECGLYFKQNSKKEILNKVFGNLCVGAV